MIIGPFTLSRGPRVPYIDDGSTSQSYAIGGDGSVTVIDHPFEEERFFRLQVGLPVDEARRIAGFLKYGVGFRRETFSITDDFGVTYVVRYWDDRVRMKYITSTFVELDLLFRREVEAV